MTTTITTARKRLNAARTSIARERGIPVGEVHGFEAGQRAWSGVCPNCGSDTEHHEDNGLSTMAPGYTILCVARVAPKDRSWTHVEPDPDQIDGDGKVACGFQWEPNA